MYVTRIQSHTEYLTEHEQQTLESVLEYFDEMNSSEITEMSHKEIGWIQTETARLISYRHAETLLLTV
ncbi:MAG: DUF4065 domain-containing protein [Candidatus Fermentibacteraceae bacterium]|nr:DUF4065 domain-containing protein [Candidatus Fermentibacteraceae bacterium]